MEHVEADKIVIVTDDGSKDAYTLRKFRRTNRGTCFNQRPVVRRDQLISAGQVIADGPATSNGEVSLGKNALIGFMTWEGYNYEDAVLLNERLVRDDVYTSPISRSIRTRHATPSWDRRKSPARCPTSATMC